MSNIEVAKTLIENIHNQSTLLLSLTTALIGGTAALLVQLKIRNGKILPLELPLSLIFGVLLLGASSLAAWAVVGALIDKIPVMMNIEYDGASFSSIREVRSSTALSFLANVQFFSFLLGCLLTFWGLTRIKR